MRIVPSFLPSPGVALQQLNKPAFYGITDRRWFRAMAMLLLSLVLANTDASADPAVDLEQGKLVAMLSTEPPNLDSATTTDVVSLTVLSHVMEGLLQGGSNGELLPGIAERWQLSDRGAKFWLRADARWSDGVAVRAQDFVYAWRRAIDPAVASPYAFVLYPIKNAEAISNGKLPLSAFGARAISDRELVVEFEQRCPYFLSLVKSMTYFPQRQDVVEKWGRAYAADADKLVFNGRFTIDRWVHGARLVLKRNENYWDQEAAVLNEIDFAYFTHDPSAAFNLFKNGSIAYALLDNNAMENAIQEGFGLGQFATGSLYYLSFNFRESQLSHHSEFRKALQALLDPSLLVNKVMGKPGTRPAYSLFPSYLQTPWGEFASAFPPSNIEYSLDRARGWLARLRERLGADTLPPVVLLTSDSAHARAQAQYYQYLLKQGLGLDVRITSLSFKQYIQEMRAGRFDIALAGWGPDFDDPITYGDLFASWNPNNRGRYKSDEYDAAVRLAQRSIDPAERYSAFDTMQKLIAADVPIIPTYERFDLYVQHPSLKGVVRMPSGPDPDLRRARLVAP